MIARFKVSFLALLLFAMIAVPSVAFAQGEDPTPEPPDTSNPSDVVVVVEEAPTEDAAPTTEVGLSLDSVVALLVFLLGFFPILGGSAGTLIATVVDILKSVGLVPNKWAAVPILLLNFAAIVVMFVVFGLRPGEAIPADLDATLQQMTDFIATALLLASSLGFGKLFHDKVMAPMSDRFSHSSQGKWGVSLAAPRLDGSDYDAPKYPSKP